MDLRRLRTFVAIAELGTVSKAALRLRISQSALSRQISDLEKEFRVRLFDRVGRRLVLTATGEELRLGGVFREIVPPERVVLTFAWEEEGERGLETLVTVTFAERDGKTEMTFRQTPFQSVEERDGHRGGWSSSFDRLQEYVTH